MESNKRPNEIQHSKATYATPEFRAYGNLAQLTMTLALTMANDHATGSANKTS
jgi:hypothetical protein